MAFEQERDPLSTAAPGLMWSSRPLTSCRLEESGVWTDVPDTHLELVLVNDVTSLISYSMVVVAAKPQLPGSSFLGEQRSSGGSKDFLQVCSMLFGSLVSIQQSVVSATKKCLPLGPLLVYFALETVG